HEMIPITALIGKGLFQKRMDEVDIARVAEYAVEDAEVAFELADLVERQLREQGLWDLYWDLERPLIDVLVEMQANGIRGDAEQLRAQNRDVEQRHTRIRRDIYEQGGREFNID